MADEEITIVKAEDKHREEILHLLKESFFTREPLAVAVGMRWEEDLVEFVAKINAITDQGYSFVALNSAGHVIGCRLSAVIDIEKDKDPEPDYIEIDEKTPRLKLLASIFRSLMSGWTKELPDSNRIMEFVLVCVEEKYGNRGIAQKMVEKSLKLAHELQVDYVYTIATNWRTQRLFDKLEFTTVRQRNYEEFVDETGNPKLNMKDTKDKCMKWMVKKIKQ